MKEDQLQQLQSLGEEVRDKATHLLKKIDECDENLKRYSVHYKDLFIDSALKFIKIYQQKSHLIDYFLSWVDKFEDSAYRPEIIKHALDTLIDKDFLKACTDNIIPVTEILSLMHRANKSHSRDAVMLLFNLSETKVKLAISNQTLPLTSLLTIKETTTALVFFPNYAVEKRIGLLLRLVEGYVLDALNDKILEMDKIIYLAQIDSYATKDLLDHLTPHGIDLMRKQEIAFDDIFALGKKHGPQKMLSFIKGLNRLYNPWFEETNLHPREVFQIALAYQGDFIELCDLLHEHKMDVVLEMFNAEWDKMNEPTMRLTR